MRIVDVLVAVLYPPICPGCARALTRPGRPRFCGTCLRSLRAVSGPCPRCAEPGTAPLCDRCRLRPPPYSRAAACWAYQESSPLVDALTRWKYARDLEAGTALAEQFAAQIRCPQSCYDLIVPIPLHPAKLRRRGFNQAAVLARALTRRRPHLGPLHARALARRSPTPAQARLRGRARTDNVRDAFVAAALSPGARVLLIDDVLTTGATAEAVARALRRAGAREILVWTVARAPGGGY